MFSAFSRSVSCGIEAEARFDVVVVVGRDVQGFETVQARKPRRRNDVVGRKRQMLDARSEFFGNEMPASVRRFSAPFMVMRSVPVSFSTTWLRTTPAGSMISTIGVFCVSKIDGVEQQPGQHFIIGDRLGDMVDRAERPADAGFSSSARPA
jgi:hypothetical protein